MLYSNIYIYKWPVGLISRFAPPRRCPAPATRPKPPRRSRPWPNSARHAPLFRTRWPRAKRLQVAMTLRPDVSLAVATRPVKVQSLKNLVWADGSRRDLDLSICGPKSARTYLANKALQLRKQVLCHLRGLTFVKPFNFRHLRRAKT